MRETRRRLLLTMAGIAAGAVACPSELAGQATPHPQPMPSPNAPNPNAPAGLERAGVDDNPKKQGVSPLAWSQIKADTDRLFQMTTEFRDHIEQTNLSSTLPLPLIKEAKQIEKMAKQIQERLKG
ncbi:MAG: hypothetical protein JOZ33_08620 [Acidobacteriaceae bacterium]|nr:hypothetical protein [Acidobacteriaceae bacterium]